MTSKTSVTHAESVSTKMYSVNLRVCCTKTQTGLVAAAAYLHMLTDNVNDK